MGGVPEEKPARLCCVVSKKSGSGTRGFLVAGWSGRKLVRKNRKVVRHGAKNNHGALLCVAEAMKGGERARGEQKCDWDLVGQGNG